MVNWDARGAAADDDDERAQIFFKLTIIIFQFFVPLQHSLSQGAIAVLYSRSIQFQSSHGECSAGKRARNEIIKSKTIIIEFMHSRN